MGCYINAYASYDTLASEIKDLIPDAGMRRRMSPAVRMGVAAAMECLSQLPDGVRVDAVITATGLGCLADSEKFLRSIIESDERMLNPTPFIQSTFNTVGAAVGLLDGNHSYNMTYVHGGCSFESALLDAVMKIEQDGARHVLVGAFDESTGAQSRIMERMGLWRKHKGGQGADFFVLSREPLPGCAARLDEIEFSAAEETAGGVMERYSLDGSRTAVVWDDHDGGCYHTAPARSLRRGVEMIRDGASAAIVRNECMGAQPTLMILECVRG